MSIVEEELTFFEFAEKFLSLNDMKTPVNLDIASLGIEIESLLPSGEVGFMPMNSFIVKDSVDSYYQLGDLRATADHRIMNENSFIRICEHPDAKEVNEEMFVVDTSVEETKNYIANGFVNHNTTPGGMALPFHSSTRIKLGAGSPIKNKDGDVVGINVSAKTIKNKVAPPFRTCQFEIHFGVGVKEHEQVTDLLRSSDDVTVGGKTYSVEGAGAWKTLAVSDEKTGEVLVEKKFTKSGMEDLLNNPEYSPHIELMLEEILVKKFQGNPDFDTDSYEEVRAVAMDVAENDLS